MLSERQLIERIRKLTKISDPNITLPIGDDAAVLRWPSSDQLVLAKDILVENRHFRRCWTVPEFLAEKSLAVNLSDLAAMGAEPRGCLLGLTLADGLDSNFGERFLDRFAELSAQWQCPLLGGDLSGGEQLHVSVTVLGSTHNPAWLRSGGQPGDILLLVGTCGWAAQGLDQLSEIGSLPNSLQTRQQLREFCTRQGASADLVEAQLLPRPLIREAAWFASQRCIHAAIDISDGLAGDIGQLAQDSQLAAILDWAALELLPRPADVTIEVLSLLSGGEDYALVLALSPHDWEQIREAYPATLEPACQIGELLAGRPQISIRRNQRIEPLTVHRYDHFPEHVQKSS